MRIILAITLVLAFATQTSAWGQRTAETGPLRVFLLVGQSNMQGKGKIQHLEELIAESETAADYKHLKNGGSWVELEDVWI